MHEIAELADDCSVFRNGRHVATFAAGTQERRRDRRDDDRPRIQPRLPAQAAAARRDAPARRRSRSRGLAWGDAAARHSLAVRPGEIVGLGGLDGQGQRELLLALFGVLRGVSGEVAIDGRPVQVREPAGRPRPPTSASR